MSAYITIYIQSVEGGPYLELDSFGRSSTEFGLLDNVAVYGKTIPFTSDNITALRCQCNDDIDRQKEMIAREKSDIEFLSSLKVDSETLDDIMQRLWDSRESIRNFEEEIEALEYFKMELTFLMNVIASQEYNDHKAQLFLSYEDDPNYNEEVEEFMSK